MRTGHEALRSAPFHCSSECSRSSTEWSYGAGGGCAHTSSKEKCEHIIRVEAVLCDCDYDAQVA